MASAHGALSLAYVISALRVRVAAWGGRLALETVLVVALHRRLGEIGLRMERLLARFRAGRLGVRTRHAMRDAGADAGADTGADTGADAASPAAVRARRVSVLPSRFGWLLPVGAHEAGTLSAQLRAVLAEPEMVALLKAAPQAVRLLRPLCRALAIETDVLRPGVAPVVREKKPRGVRVRKPRPKMDLGRIPLPRGVLSAARRQGFGKWW